MIGRRQSECHDVLPRVSASRNGTVTGTHALAVCQQSNP
jgi:hypothetical protein